MITETCYRHVCDRGEIYWARNVPGKYKMSGSLFSPFLLFPTIPATFTAYG